MMKKRHAVYIGASVGINPYFRPMSCRPGRAYDAGVQLPAALQSFIAEPAVDGAPNRVWRDWVVVGITSITAIGEGLFRNDAEWLGISVGWRWASVVIFFLTVIPTFLIRRTRPLLATSIGFGASMTFGVLVAVFETQFGGVWSTVIILAVLYALFRWGSGRDGTIGLFIAAAAGFIGNLADPGSTIGEWIGGYIVLAIPILLGLSVRYQRTARERALSDAKSLERAELARELHDTVAHHVSAIAVQAQAGRALAVHNPEKALAVLTVIEEAASRTLIEMRSMVGTLREGAEAELAPQQGLRDLHRLADDSGGDVRVSVSIDPAVGVVASASQSAVYRIARESITNALRHARDATQIAVAVTGTADSITLVVSDDGAPVMDRKDVSGYGLLGMAERAELLGGSFGAGPRPTRGWQVVANIPRSGAGR